MIFATSPYFVALPSGVISTSNVTVAASSSSGDAPSSASPPLGVPFAVWGVLVLLVVVAGIVVCTLINRAGEALGEFFAAQLNRSI